MEYGFKLQVAKCPKDVISNTFKDTVVGSCTPGPTFWRGKRRLGHLPIPDCTTYIKISSHHNSH